jgi:hypothetical protein
LNFPSFPSITRGSPSPTRTGGQDDESSKQTPSNYSSPLSSLSPPPHTFLSSTLYTDQAHHLTLCLIGPMAVPQLVELPTLSPLLSPQVPMQGVPSQEDLRSLQPFETLLASWGNMLPLHEWILVPKLPPHPLELAPGSMFWVRTGQGLDVPYTEWRQWVNSHEVWVVKGHEHVHYTVEPESLHPRRQLHCHVIVPNS